MLSPIQSKAVFFLFLNPRYPDDITRQQQPGTAFKYSILVQQELCCCHLHPGRNYTRATSTGLGPTLLLQEDASNPLSK